MENYIFFHIEYFIRFLCLSEYTTIISGHNINLIVSVIEMKSFAFCEGGNGVLILSSKGGEIVMSW